jgi:uncharacterized protein
MLLGRKNQIQQLKGYLQSNQAELIAIYGRRRVGKTYLIKNVYHEQLLLQFTGTKGATVKNQLFKFNDILKEAFNTQNLLIDKPTTWADGFKNLKNALINYTGPKQVIFFDELPWIATSKSNFLEEFAYWWNDWASTQNLKVVICGSAAAWLIKHVISNKGGLHNRVTQRINLLPFTLQETEEYLKYKGINWNHYQICQLYMAVGGIPIYLNFAEPGLSATQVIQKIYFEQDDFMRTEFINLFASLFLNYKKHIQVIQALCKQWRGYTRAELVQYLSMADGGSLSIILQELQASGFIIKINAYNNKSNNAVYRISDEYSIFYTKFIEPKAVSTSWQSYSNTQAYKVWCGYAFENLCIKHVQGIKQGLGIAGIDSKIYSMVHKAKDAGQGFQLDLIIDRADNTINLCEIKFAPNTYSITPALSNTLQQRRAVYQTYTSSKKLLLNTLITTYGYNASTDTAGVIDKSLDMGCLFLVERFE